MTEPLRVGLIGTGMMGIEHILNLLLSPDIRIVALSDPTPSSLAWARLALGQELPAGSAAPAVVRAILDRRRRMGVTGPAPEAAFYADAAAMLRETKLDAVIISSPNHTHRDVIEPLLGRDLHILCEKPLCSDLADAHRIARLAERHPGVFWVGMEYRYMPAVTTFVEDVRAGAVGRLVMLSLREHRFPFLPKVGDWNRFSRNTGGTMVEKCCHFFDLMRLVVGSEAVRVYCSGAMDVNHLDERYGGERPDIIDNSYTIVDFADGKRAMLDLSMFAEGAETQEELTAVGDKARLDVAMPEGELVLSPRVPWGTLKQPQRRLIPVDPAIEAAGSHNGATYFQHRAFIDAIRQGKPPEVSALDGLRAVEIGAAAELSAREKRAVDIEELRRR